MDATFPWKSQPIVEEPISPSSSSLHCYESPGPYESPESHEKPEPPAIVESLPEIMTTGAINSKPKSPGIAESPPEYMTNGTVNSNHLNSIAVFPETKPYISAPPLKSEERIRTVHYV